MTFKLKANSQPNKGLIFAGCSFTWGQGLYYYSGMNSVKTPELHRYDSTLVRLPHFNFLEKFRFPRLVSNHFKTFELCQPFNGGSHDSIINFWNYLFREVPEDRLSIRNGNILKTQHTEYGTYLDYEDVSHVIFQFTQWERSRSPVNYPDREPMSHHDYYFHYKDDFIKWLQVNNLDFEQYDDIAISRDITLVKEFLQQFENKGIKTYVLVWPYNISKRVLNDEWLASRFIKIKYNSREVNDIWTIQQLFPELLITNDYENFLIPPIDNHPSMKCHRVIADNIIKMIEKDF